MNTLQTKKALVLSLALGVSLGVAACSGGSQPTPPAARVEPSAAPATPAAPNRAAAPAAAPSATAEQLTIDATASSVSFVASKITASHEGRFSDVSGHINLEPSDLTRSSIDLRIGIASLSIEPARLQGHLLTPDLLDSARYPEATFRSTSIVAATAGAYTVTGDMTIHGQTKRITFPATINVAPDGVVATAEMTLDRRDFGVVYPGMPDDLIRDEVVIRFDVRAPR